MPRPCLVLVGLLLLAAVVRAQGPADDKVVLVVHGGAGAEERGKLPADLEKTYKAELARALKAGHAVLRSPKGTSLDAVEAAIKVLEDAPHFNAGKGAVFNREGRHELNAAIMEGTERRAGAVAGVARIKNPIAAARAVMEKSPHVLLIGEGAERFAREQQLEIVSPLYFWNEGSWKALKEAEAKAARKAAAAGAAGPHFGTVGAVAVDRHGHVAAGTSTGGLTFVYPGRVGDSPIIGAGTYAEDAACGVSCTGVGELFIRHTVAADLAARVKYKGDDLKAAAQAVLDGLPKRPGGVGGLIALDRQGRYAMPYNTNGMYRGRITAGGAVTVAIYDEGK